LRNNDILFSFNSTFQKPVKYFSRDVYKTAAFSTEMGDNIDIREPGKKSCSAINTFFKRMWHWACAY
jgi:hypothetical protein